MPLMLNVELWWQQAFGECFVPFVRCHHLFRFSFSTLFFFVSFLLTLFSLALWLAQLLAFSFVSFYRNRYFQCDTFPLLIHIRISSKNLGRREKMKWHFFRIVTKRTTWKNETACVDYQFTVFLFLCKHCRFRCQRVTLCECVYAYYTLTWRFYFLKETDWEKCLLLQHNLLSNISIV